MAYTTGITSDFVADVLEPLLPQHALTGFMRYQKIEELGRGGKAEVWRCRDVTLGREVAVKLLHQSLLDSVWEQQMLVREARIMAALNHPAIPKVHDLGRDYQSRPYYAMTLVNGMTLRKLLQSYQTHQSDNLPTDSLLRLVTILIQVAEILEYAHQMKVVHCDLKPENIIIGHIDSVHLVDWGLASITVETESEEAPFESMRGLQGSPLYMSPEQTDHAPWLGPASDVFSLGVLLYECLTFDTPFRGADLSETLENVLSADPQPPRERSPSRNIPRELEHVCLRALEKHSSDRFTSMADFAFALRDCQLDLLINYERQPLNRQALNQERAYKTDFDPMLVYV